SRVAARSIGGAARAAQAGQAEIRSSGSSTPGLSGPVRAARIRSGSRWTIDRHRWDAASLPNQTAMLALLRPSGGHAIKRRLQNRRGEDRQIAEEGIDSRIESEPQSRLEACLQKRGADLTAL